MKWKNKPIDFWMSQVKETSGGLSYSERCEVCDISWELEISEQEFLDRFDSYDRAQLIATYRSRMERKFVMSTFPRKVPKRNK